MKPLEFLFQLLFPPRCPVCGELVPIGGQCAVCADGLARLELGLDEMYAANGGRTLDFVDSAVACYRYAAGAREIVHHYKFDGRPALAGEMAGRMAALAREVYDGAGLTAAVCVPSFRRETDHAQRLAGGTAARLGLAFDPDTLVKIRRTEKQHELDGAGRAENLRDAFAVPDPAAVRGGHILLCDDVITSGATMNECARALKAAGAAYVFGLAFAATGDERA